MATATNPSPAQTRLSAINAAATIHATAHGTASNANALAIADDLNNIANRRTQHQEEATVCCNCNSFPIFNFELKQCLECLKKMICAKCQKTMSEYNYRFQFKYAIQYNIVRLCVKSKKYIPGYPDQSNIC
jgi:hypothetical protein